MRFLLLLILAASIVTPALAQQPLDPRADVLMPSSLTDINSLYTQLQIEPRGEFESTLEYQERARVAAGNIHVAVPISSKSESGTPANSLCWQAEITYDPDAEEMRVSLPTDKRVMWKDVVRIGCDSAFVQSYTGTNRFGVSAEVREYVEDIFLVRIVDLPRYLGQRRFEDIISIQRSFPIARAEAQEIKPYLRVALVFQPTLPPPPDDGSASTLDFLTRPWLAYADTAYQTPTISNPRHVIAHQHYVSGRDATLWIYDSRSGQVVHKFRFSDQE